MTYDNFGQWVPDNSDIDTSPDELSDFGGVAPTEYDDSVGSVGGPLTHNSPPVGMRASDIDMTTMMPDNMGPMRKNG